jgi:hypothetical protein
VFADRLIVVLGTIRSGTTWLTNMLGAHPEVANTEFESWLFLGLWDLWQNAHAATGDGLGAHLEPGQATPSIRRFCDRVFTAALDHHAPHASRFVEKTPGNSTRLPLLAAVYPDAWYVHIIRDGRDVTRSILKAPWGQTEASDAAAYWAALVRHVQEQSWRLPRFREVRYEDLLGDPAGQTAELLRWMELDVDPTVEARLEERAGVEVVRFASTDAVGAGKWRDMSDEELAEIYQEAGQRLVELGYVDGRSQ